MTPADLLQAYADLAEAHPFEMTSPGGPALQAAFVAFLRANFNDQEGANVDLALLMARALVAINMANHGGAPCRTCLQFEASRFGRQIGIEVANIDTEITRKGMH